MDIASSATAARSLCNQVRARYLFAAAANAEAAAANATPAAAAVRRSLALLGRFGNAAVTAVIIAAMWLLWLRLEVPRRTRRRWARAEALAAARDPPETKGSGGTIAGDNRLERDFPRFTAGVNFLIDLWVFYCGGFVTTLAGAVLGFACKPGGRAHAVLTLLICAAPWLVPIGF